MYPFKLNITRKCNALNNEAENLHLIGLVIITAAVAAAITVMIIISECAFSLAGYFRLTLGQRSYECLTKTLKPTVKNTTFDLY